MIASIPDLQPIEILLVEDNPVDVMITKKAFSNGRVYSNLHVAEDGEEAMNFLYKRGKYSSAPSPDMILLDLNLPKKDGRQVLEEIKHDPNPAADSCYRSHDLGRPGRYLEKLRSASKLLYYQTGKYGTVYQGSGNPWRVLVYPG